jgi:hypothetical protein
MQASLPPKVHLQHHFSAYGHLGRVRGEGRWEAIDERQHTRGTGNSLELQHAHSKNIKSVQRGSNCWTPSSPNLAHRTVCVHVQHTLLVLVPRLLRLLTLGQSHGFCGRNGQRLDQKVDSWHFMSRQRLFSVYSRPESTRCFHAHRRALSAENNATWRTSIGLYLERKREGEKGVWRTKEINKEGD